MRKTLSGFTLIELLVVIAIIGILAAIAIPQYSSYRTRAFNKAAQSDLHNAVTAQQAAFIDHDAYSDCMNGGCEPALPGYRRSTNVSIACTPRSNFSIFQCSTRHSSGNRTYYYDSQMSVYWDTP